MFRPAKSIDYELTDNVLCVAWKDAETLAAGLADGSIVIMEHSPSSSLASTKRIHPPSLVLSNAHSFGVLSLQWNGDLLASGGQDGCLRVWKFAASSTGMTPANCTLTLQASAKGRQWVQSVLWLPDGSIATARGKTISLWNAEAQLLRTFPDCCSTVLDLRWCPQLRVLLAAEYGAVCMFTMDLGGSTKSDDNNVTNDTNEVVKFEEKGSFLCVRSAPIPGQKQGALVAAGMQDEMILLCSVGDPKRQPSEHAILRGFRGKVTDIALDGTGQYMAVGGSPSLMLWNLGYRHQSLKRNRMDDQQILCVGHRDTVTGISFHPRQPLVASCSRDGSVLVYDATQKPMTRNDMNLLQPVLACTPPRMETIALVAEELGAEAGSTTKTIHAERVLWNTDGTALASTYSNATLRVSHISVVS